ncbi:hypothetical protein PoB_001361100 [Plakobranchus ocellatus]|uniref:UDENN domain-containing protein n=1 Tax=Plakobranchus ocellatus TaxID=259542 RepID=A0AAV3YUJ8_9GAST|nr:hypothetical protein PoB_001361100 [Plakobranchus ocellatus]
MYPFASGRQPLVVVPLDLPDLQVGACLLFIAHLNKASGKPSQTSWRHDRLVLRLSYPTFPDPINRIFSSVGSPRLSLSLFSDVDGSVRGSVAMSFVAKHGANRLSYALTRKFIANVHPLYMYYFPDRFQRVVVEDSTQGVSNVIIVRARGSRTTGDGSNAMRLLDWLRTSFALFGNKLYCLIDRLLNSFSPFPPPFPSILLCHKSVKEKLLTHTTDVALKFYIWLHLVLSNKAMKADFGKSLGISPVS